VVVEKHLTVGEVVSETNAFILSDLNQVWATFAVPPTDLGKVTTGRAVKVSSPDMNVEVEGRWVMSAACWASKTVQLLSASP
jgi:cobalt-zinc-cadmium efflux system membrane fusion protein